jgi:aspartokinase-like uncharacterized kinase
VSRAVVKLGGSTADQAEMGEWIAELARSSLPLVVVPGGGPFADQVRNAQKRMNFSDSAAHAMAILAMDQFGHVILDCHERFLAARSLDDIEHAVEGGKIPVWLPSTLATLAPDIPASWDITSDSLAAWLAGKLDVDALLLIKQTGAFSDHDDIDSLTANGIVDAGFAGMLPADIDLHLASPDDAATAGPMLSSGRLPGTRIARPVTPVRKAG